MFACASLLMCIFALLIAGEKSDDGFDIFVVGVSLIYWLFVGLFLYVFGWKKKPKENEQKSRNISFDIVIIVAYLLEILFTIGCFINSELWIGFVFTGTTLFGIISNVVVVVMSKRLFDGISNFRPQNILKIYLISTCVVAIAGVVMCFFLDVMLMLECLLITQSLIFKKEYSSRLTKNR